MCKLNSKKNIDKGVVLVEKLECETQVKGCFPCPKAPLQEKRFPGFPERNRALQLTRVPLMEKKKMMRECW